MGVVLAAQLFRNMETRFEAEPLFDVQVELNSFESEFWHDVLSIGDFVPHKELYIEVADLYGTQV